MPGFPLQCYLLSCVRGFPFTVQILAWWHSLPLASPHSRLWNPDRLCAPQPCLQTPHYKSHYHGHKPSPPLVLSQLITSALLPAVTTEHTPYKPSCLCTCHASSWSHSPLFAWLILQPLCVFSRVLLPGIWAPQWLCRPAVPLRLAQKWAWSTPGGAFVSLCHLLRWPRLLKDTILASSFLFPRELMGTQ